MARIMRTIGVFGMAVAAHATASAGPSVSNRSAVGWLTSWYAAPQAGWVGATPLSMNVPAQLLDQSVRDTMRLSAGGPRIRVAFSNRYGREPVTLGETCVALVEDDQPCRRLTFSGKPGTSMQPGATAISDALEMAVEPLTRLAITSFFPEHTAVGSFHWGGTQTSVVSAGPPNEAARAGNSVRVDGRLFLSAVMVEADKPGRTVVTLGDSITDGNGSTPDADRRWPDFLAQQLASRGIAVANAGISGGRLLSDGMGESALARLEHDVLSQTGISDVIVLLGINDIGWPGSPFAPDEAPMTLDRLAVGYRQLIAAARVRGIRVTAGTLPPFEGALQGTPFEGHFSPAKEALRQDFNRWIRTSGVFDSVIDFDAVLRNPANPTRMLPRFDSGDHLHPGDDGYRAMADAVLLESLLP